MKLRAYILCLLVTQGVTQTASLRVGLQAIQSSQTNTSRYKILPKKLA
jgi:hypothetical protein